MINRTGEFFEGEVLGRNIIGSIVWLKPAYAIAANIEENPISDQHQKTIVIMSAPTRDNPKIGQTSVQQRRGKTNDIRTGSISR